VSVNKKCLLCNRVLYPNRYDLKVSAPYHKYGFTCYKCYFKIEISMPKYLPEEQHLKFFNSKPLSFFKIHKIKSRRKC